MVNISSVAGRVARSGNNVYSLTKHGAGAFSESLRQEVTRRYVRVSLVEPGATASAWTAVAVPPLGVMRSTTASTSGPIRRTDRAVRLLPFLRGHCTLSSAN